MARSQGIVENVSIKKTAFVKSAMIISAQLVSNMESTVLARNVESLNVTMVDAEEALYTKQCESCNRQKCGSCMNAKKEIWLEHDKGRYCPNCVENGAEGEDA